MTHFYPLQIKFIRQETKDCVSILFDVPPELQPTFAYHQGQHLTLKAEINGQELRRNYSLCSSPLDNEWRIAVKKTDFGLFSTYANHTLKAGDTLEVLPPMGKFFIQLDANQSKQYVAVAAGSGITPLLSIIKTTLLTEPQSSFALVYANRGRDSIIFKEELENLKNQFLTRLAVHHIFSREKTDSPINHGRMDADKCSLIFTKLIPLAQTDAFFICGPAEMIFTVRDYLEKNGFSKKQIHYELFAAGQNEITLPKKAAVELVEDTKAKVVIKLDGIESSFELPYNGDSILDAALQNGAGLPYACKGGVCCTCKARLVSGEVIMDVNYGLEPEEIAAGYILTCQSHPTTEKVVVDFD
jgi:ring-1,2-phenylacetyl-CoA epoxidase subunit PaaE